MKALQELTPRDKARLLHELFPFQMPGMIEFIKHMCVSIKQREAVNRALWNNGFLTFDLWLFLLNHVEQIIDQQPVKLCKNAAFFSSRLYEGHMGYFTTHCIILYAQQPQYIGSKFKKAVDLLLY